MLLVISGTETIKKSYLGYFLSSQLNSLDCDSFDDYNNQYPFHYKMQFRDIFYDYGANSTVTYPEGGDYSQLIKTYQTRKTDVLVITGSYSRAFVEMIANDIENFKVLNIIRNPSTTYVIDASLDDPYGPYDTDLKVPLLKRRYISSLLNSITLKNIDIVKTVKFEKMLETQQLENIKLPSLYKNYNGYITSTEKVYLTFKNSVKPTDVELFNKVFSKLASNLTASNYNLPDRLISNLPENIFQMLGYDSLTTEQINGHTL
jgi:hypothetical protein